MDYFDDQKFTSINFSEQPFIRGEYDQCTFEGCTFVDLTETKLLTCTFINCNLSNTRLQNAILQDVTFSECKMLGLHFEHCNSFGLSFSVEKSQLDHSSFYQVKITGVRLHECSLKGVDFTEAQLNGASLVGCDLTDAHFERTNLEKADLRQATNYLIDPEANRIKGAKFSLPDVLGLLQKYQIKVS